MSKFFPPVKGSRGPVTLLRAIKVGLLSLADSILEFTVLSFTESECFSFFFFFLPNQPHAKVGENQRLIRYHREGSLWVVNLCFCSLDGTGRANIATHPSFLVASVSFFFFLLPNEYGEAPCPPLRAHAACKPTTTCSRPRCHLIHNLCPAFGFI